MGRHACLPLLATLLLVLAGAAPARAGEWLAGDLHVHSCFSHDVFCGEQDEVRDAYTLGLPVGARFQEAALRGLDYLAITDHNDVRSVTDPGFGSAGVVGIPGYENSIRGHAQMLGATTVLDNGDASAAAINAERDVLHAAGGLLQANHPGYRSESPFASCDATGDLHWEYGYAVQPDTIEVWNPTSPVRDAETWLECWLARGARIAITGGSDAHWADNQGVIGIGNPTTWVFAADRSRAAVLAAIRAGRTSLSRLTPAQGGAPLLLEADPLRDGSFSAIAGDRVAPGTPMRVRSASAIATGLVTVRANGATLVDEARLPPGGEIAFSAPARPGWVRAVLTSVPAAATPPTCAQGESISTCGYDALMQGMTSPLYVGR